MSKMDLANWILGSTFLLIGATIISFSYLRLWQNYRNRKDGSDGFVSGLPLMGPMAVLLGYSILPVPFSPWALLVIPFDPDTILLLVVLPVILMRDASTTND